MTKKAEALPVTDPPDARRLFRNIAEHPILWKHDTPDARLIVPGEVCDFDHLTEGEIDLLIGLNYITPVTDSAPSIPAEARARTHSAP